MSKKKTPASAPRPTTPSKNITTTKVSNRVKDAKDTKKFFMVLGIATLFLIIFIYFMMAG